MTEPTEGSSVDTLSLANLGAACRNETKRYQRGQRSDGRFCLEIFHRALRQVANNPESVPTVVARGTKRRGGIVPRYSDEDSRSLLIEIYSEFIKAQINRASFRASSLDDLVNQVWLHFWQAANNGLAFETLEGALAYLKQTTVSTLIRQNRRARALAREEFLQHHADSVGDSALADRSPDLFEQHTRQRFTERCRLVLTDGLEYRVFWMRYGLGFPPREIAERLVSEKVSLSGRLPTARSVSDLLERSCKRLCQDEEIRDLLQSD